ncbi:carbohydrate-binding family 9-like protein [Flavobacteriaceae bacterium]|nr:carbohydrate-binding family 9-like protein [Flavobacteriaceae bacterium]
MGALLDLNFEDWCLFYLYLKPSSIPNLFNDMKTLYRFLSFKALLRSKSFLNCLLCFYNKSWHGLLSCSCGLLLICCSCTSSPKTKVALQLPKSYVTPFTDEQIIIDGKDDDAAWINTAWTDPFVDIEGVETPKFETKIKILWDDTYVYFFSKMKDPHVWGNLKQRDTVIFYNNDFEIFIDPDGDTHNYMEIEINALNTVWDLFLTRPYRNHPKVLDQWDIKGLQSEVYVSGTINDPSDIDQFWSVEIALPWESLLEADKGNKPPEGQTWRMNFSRVFWDFEIVDHRYHRKKDSQGKYLPEYNWVWSPQEVINMHEPEKWGFVHFAPKSETEQVREIDYPDDAALVLWMYSHYRVKLASSKNSNKSKIKFPIRESHKGSNFVLEQIVTPVGTILKSKSPKTSSVYYINQEGKLSSKKY